MNAHERINAPLREVDAAAYCGVSVSFLRASRLGKPRTSGPPYVKLGRAVRYLTTDLDRWIESHRRQGVVMSGETYSAHAAEAMAAVG